MVIVDAPPSLVHRHQHAAHPILAHDVGLRRKSVANVCHVAHIQGEPSSSFSPADRSVRRSCRGVPFISTLYSVGPILVVPAGRIRFCAATAFTMSAGAKPVGLELSAGSRSTWICADLAAIGVRRGRALHRGQLRAQEIIAQVEQLLFRQRLAAQAQAAQSASWRPCMVMTSGGVVPGRQAAHGGLAHRCHLRHAPWIG